MRQAIAAGRMGDEIFARLRPEARRGNLRGDERVLMERKPRVVVMPVHHQLDGLRAMRIRPIMVVMLGDDVSGDSKPGTRRENEGREDENYRTRPRSEAHAREYSGSGMASPR